MSVIPVTELKDFDISQDGRNTVLNFTNKGEDSVSLKISTLDLQRITQEIGILLTKARQLSEVSKQNIVPFLRPSRFRADLLEHGSTVVLAFGFSSGLDHYYGLEPIDADKLADQIRDASERGKIAKPLIRN